MLSKNMWVGPPPGDRRNQQKAETDAKANTITTFAEKVSHHSCAGSLVCVDKNIWVGPPPGAERKTAEQVKLMSRDS